MSGWEATQEWLGSHLTSTLSGWQWAILAAIPPLIVLLYFLKLKRRPVEVPSTYLWHKSIEDLHVNSIWQRLRNNLLMFLQLLLILLAAVALLRPSWLGVRFTERHLIFLVDNSASMQATDADGPRLDEAKRQVGRLIDQMRTGDVAMLISFADVAQVEQNFTDDRRRLRQALDAIRPTERSTSLLEALRLAAGLANPGRSAAEASDVQVAEAVPAELFIFSDGRFEPVAGFSLGNLKATFVPIGDPQTPNIAIGAFSVGRSETRPEGLQAFGRLENFGPADATASVELHLDGNLIDADRIEVPAGESRGVAFDLATVEAGVLRLKLTDRDGLAVDDQAWAVVTPPRQSSVLLVTPGNEPLESVVETRLVAEIARVDIEPPEFLKDKKYAAQTAGGAYDLVIYDRCRPERMPPCNTLFVGSLPPAGGWAAKDKAERLQIIDTEASHPLLQWVDLGEVKLIGEGTPLVVPPGGTVLADTDVGPVLAIAPRETFEDAVLGFTILDEKTGADGKPGKYFNTEWHIRSSFPAFVFNVFDYLAGGRQAAGQEGVRSGRPVALDVLDAKAALQVRTPAGRTVSLPPQRTGKATFADTGEQGIYEVQSGGKPAGRFAVNLFDPAESQIRPDPEPKLKIGFVEVEGKRDWQTARRELWKWLLLAGLGVLGVEWYIYNRRVFV